MPKENFKAKVGTVTFDEPYETGYLYEVAAWKTQYALEPGTYDVYIDIGHDEMNGNAIIKFQTDEIPGVITDNHTPAIFGGMPHGDTGKDEVGKPVNEKMRLDPRDVTQGKVQFNCEVPYLSIVKGSDWSQLKIDKDHPQWDALLKEKARFDFKERFREYEKSGSGYADKHGFLEGDKLEKGMAMGLVSYSSVISFDRYVQSRTGQDLDQLGLSFEDVLSHTEGKCGRESDIFKETLDELVKEKDLPEPRKDHEQSLSI